MVSVDARRTRKRRSQKTHAFKNRKHGPPDLVRLVRRCHPPARLAGGRSEIGVKWSRKGQDQCASAPQTAGGGGRRKLLDTSSSARDGCPIMSFFGQARKTKRTLPGY